MSESTTIFNSAVLGGPIMPTNMLQPKTRSPWKILPRPKYASEASTLEAQPELEAVISKVENMAISSDNNMEKPPKQSSSKPNNNRGPGRIPNKQLKINNYQHMSSDVSQARNKDSRQNSHDQRGSYVLNMKSLSLLANLEENKQSVRTTKGPGTVPREKPTTDIQNLERTIWNHLKQIDSKVLKHQLEFKHIKDYSLVTNPFWLTEGRKTPRFYRGWIYSHQDNEFINKTIPYSPVAVCDEFPVKDDRIRFQDENGLRFDSDLDKLSFYKEEEGVMIYMCFHQGRGIFHTHRNFDYWIENAVGDNEQNKLQQNMYYYNKLGGPTPSMLFPHNQADYTYAFLLSLPELNKSSDGCSEPTLKYLGALGHSIDYSPVELNLPRLTELSLVHAQSHFERGYLSDDIGNYSIYGEPVLVKVNNGNWYQLYPKHYVWRRNYFSKSATTDFRLASNLSLDNPPLLFSTEVEFRVQLQDMIEKQGFLTFRPLSKEQRNRFSHLTNQHSIIICAIMCYPLQKQKEIYNLFRKMADCTDIVNSILPYIVHPQINLNLTKSKRSRQTARHIEEIIGRIQYYVSNRPHADETMIKDELRRQLSLENPLNIYRIRTSLLPLTF